MREKGITLIALVISVIVMLILAGVSLNATIGENGIITKAQNAKLAQKIAGYKEELEMNIVNVMATEGIDSRERVTVLNGNVKKYILSLENNDIGKYGIVAGELYYLGDATENEYNVAKSQALRVNESGKTSEEFLAEIESKAIEVLLKVMTGDSFTTIDEEGNLNEVGIKLYDKNLLNGNKWKIIAEVSNNKTLVTYGTGWSYVEAGNVVEGLGKLTQSYIINYDSRKAVKFDATKHTMLAYGANLAILDKLVLNIDPINMSDNSAESWGNVECMNFSPNGDYDENGNLISGWFESGIRLDGVDDYIKFYGGGEFSKGYTFSFYASSNSKGIYPLCKQESSLDKSFRSTLSKDVFYFNLSKNIANSSWSENDSINNGNLVCPFKINADLSEGCYIDLVFDASTYTYKLYKNGVFEDSTTVEKTYWIIDKENDNEYAGIDILSDENIPFKIGTMLGGSPSRWVYSNMDLYCARLYNKPLSEEELIANYNATVSYHNILVNGGISETSENISGEEF